MHWLDVIAFAVLIAFGIALAVVLAFDGGALVEVLLVLLLFLAIAIRAVHTSDIVEMLRKRH